MAKRAEFKPGQLTRVFDFTKNKGLSPSRQKQVAREIASFLRDAILAKVSSSESPVAGESNFGKKKDGSPSRMQETGDMLSALKVFTNSDGQVVLSITGEEAEKADGHNKLTGRGSHLPKRRFIPNGNQNFDEDIMQTINDIIDAAPKRGE